MAHSAPSSVGLGGAGLLDGSLWGDGFASDRFASLARLRDWRLCSDDELVFLFPCLARGSAPVPERLHDWVKACAAANRGVEMAPGFSKGSFVANAGASTRKLHVSSWLEQVSAFLGVSRKSDRPIPPPAGAIPLCEDVLKHLDANEPYAFDENDSALFAFFSGLHPAYVGAVNPIYYERDTAAGWLGHINRGRPALVPSMLADYLIDITVETRSHSIVARDPVLAALVPLGFDWGKVRRGAERRRLGKDTVLRLRATPRGRAQAPRESVPAFGNAVSSG
jgi:hypothetical protein